MPRRNAIHRILIVGSGPIVSETDLQDLFKVNESRPNAVDLLKAGSIPLIVYTTAGALSFEDEKSIRRGVV